MKGFRAFILRGNVIDLAVAVVIGAAFTAVVTSIVTNVITPLIGALFNAGSLASTLIVSIPTAGKPAELRFGAVLASVVNFVVIAAVVYFVLVVPTNYLLKRAFRQQREKAPATAEPAPPTELELLAEIRDALQHRA